MRLFSISLVLILLSCSGPNALEPGYKLDEFIDFASINKIELINIKGEHFLDDKNLLIVKDLLSSSISFGGLVCKPTSQLVVKLYSKNHVITGTICDDLINFEEAEVTGSFEFDKNVNFHNF